MWPLKGPFFASFQYVLAFKKAVLLLLFSMFLAFKKAVILLLFNLFVVLKKAVWHTYFLKKSAIVVCLLRVVDRFCSTSDIA